jgi:hypothetical protein
MPVPQAFLLISYQKLITGFLVKSLADSTDILHYPAFRANHRNRQTTSQANDRSITITSSATPVAEP